MIRSSAPDLATLSGSGDRPCPGSEPGREVRYARLVRPFPVRRLPDVLYHVLADSHAIEQAVQRLLVTPPASPEDWDREMQGIANSLWSLAGRCDDAGPQIEELAEQGEHSYETAVNAVAAMFRGMQ